MTYEAAPHPRQAMYRRKLLDVVRLSCCLPTLEKALQRQFLLKWKGGTLLFFMRMHCCVPAMPTQKCCDNLHINQCTEKRNSGREDGFSSKQLICQVTNSSYVVKIKITTRTIAANKGKAFFVIRLQLQVLQVN